MEIMNKKWPISKISLYSPSLEELSEVLQRGLSENFEQVRVSVIDCPDLSQAPFHLAASGICGSEKIIDIGGPPYLLPLSQHKEKVLEVDVRVRTGGANFITCMRECLARRYGDSRDRVVGMGGVFIIHTGRAKLHVMPGFSDKPLDSDDAVNNWLKFYEMSAPLICLTEFVSHDPGLDLRVEHTHCYSDHNSGGHYHYDTTPDTVHYTAYINVARELYRVDRPQVTHQLGR